MIKEAHEDIKQAQNLKTPKKQENKGIKQTEVVKTPKVQTPEVKIPKQGVKAQAKDEQLNKKYVHEEIKQGKQVIQSPKVQTTDVKIPKPGVKSQTKEEQVSKINAHEEKKQGKGKKKAEKRKSISEDEILPENEDEWNIEEKQIMNFVTKKSRESVEKENEPILAETGNILRPMDKPDVAIEWKNMNITFRIVSQDWHKDEEYRLFPKFNKTAPSRRSLKLSKCSSPSLFL